MPDEMPECHEGPGAFERFDNDVCTSYCAKGADTSTPESISQEGGRQPESARPEAQERPTNTGRRARRSLERFVGLVPSQFFIRESLADDLRDCQVEPFRIGHNLTVFRLRFVAECLFVDVAKKVKWFNDVGPVDPPLEATRNSRSRSCEPCREHTSRHDRQPDA